MNAVHCSFFSSIAVAIISYRCTMNNFKIKLTIPNTATYLVANNLIFNQKKSSLL